MAEQAAPATIDETSEAQFEALVAAMGHPVRSKLLFALTDKPGVTIKQLATRIAEPPRRVRYHLQPMVESGLVVVDEETRRRNTVERRYRATQLPIVDATDDHPVTIAQQQRLSLEVLKMILADARSAVASGTFGTHEGHCEVRFWAEVDRQGWDELAQIHLKAFEDIRSALARSTERIAAGSPGYLPATSAILLFESPDW
ncbi:MAG TPA: helix-turn-helix domain-containing protein [Solirubrobacterales bacterium]|nr:helix-turn-helix domain-containing protein [Solirubrobacterales bacterium]